MQISHMFSCDNRLIFKNSYFEEHLLTTFSDAWSHIMNNVMKRYAHQTQILCFPRTFNDHSRLSIMIQVTQTPMWTHWTGLHVFLWWLKSNLVVFNWLNHYVKQEKRIPAILQTHENLFLFFSLITIQVSSLHGEKICKNYFLLYSQMTYYQNHVHKKPRRQYVLQLQFHLKISDFPANQFPRIWLEKKQLKKR